MAGSSSAHEALAVFSAHPDVASDPHNKKYSYQHAQFDKAEPKVEDHFLLGTGPSKRIDFRTSKRRCEVGGTNSHLYKKRKDSLSTVKRFSSLERWRRTSLFLSNGSGMGLGKQA
jgi:hypothetical protein